MKIYIESHGCSRRKLDVSKFHRYFLVNGYTIVNDPKSADEILITTCAFKYDEEEESLAAIKNLSKYNARITVYGCLPAIAPAKYSGKFSYSVITPKDINTIDEYFQNITVKFANLDDANEIKADINYSPLSDAVEKFTTNFEFSIPFIIKSSRYVKNKYLKNEKKFFLSTSRGCLGNCSYCGVRFAVGPLVSKPVEEIVKEFSKGVVSGHTTYFITGDDVGGYGQDCGSDFCELMAALQQQIEMIPDKSLRTRIGLHFEEINPRWILRYGDKLTKHLSNSNVKCILCPIQSGSNRILGLMNRNDDIGKLMDLLKDIKANNSKIEINTQIIIGFPTETEADFEKSLEELSRFSFNNVTLFPYDDKENTKSYDLHPKVPDQVKEERVKKAQVYLRKQGIKSALCCNE